jgi:BolA protein
MLVTDAANKELTSRAERIRAALTSSFAPEQLEVEDESARHKGHAGASPAGETHFRILIVSARFAGMNRIARHRAVTDALATEFASGLHALSIKASTVGEG